MEIDRTDKVYHFGAPKEPKDDGLVREGFEPQPNYLVVSSRKDTVVYDSPEVTIRMSHLQKEQDKVPHVVVCNKATGKIIQGELMDVLTKHFSIPERTLHRASIKFAEGAGVENLGELCNVIASNINTSEDNETKEE